jgi:hypothetical protein
MAFSRLGGLRGRGLSGVRGYYISGSPVNTASYGDSLTYNVPGQPPGTIWLEQYVNGVLGYNGPFTIPMSPYTLSRKDQIGLWQSNAYAYQNGQKGYLLEQSNLYVTGSAQMTPGSTGAPPSGPLPDGFSCVASDGSHYSGSQINSIRTALNSPSWLPAGCSSAPSGSPSNGGGGGGGGGSTPPVTVATAPSIPGALPDGSTVGASYNSGNCLQGNYRFILSTGGGFATGASLPGCSETNSANCDPQFFSTLLDAIHYAISRGETPYKVDSSSEPWQLISCAIPMDPNKIYDENGSLHGSFYGGLGSWTPILIIGAVAYTLLRRKSS